MNPSQYTAVGVTAAVLTPTIMWALTWPLQPPDAQQAGGIAALLIAAFGGAHALVNALWLRPKN